MSVIKRELYECSLCKVMYQTPKEVSDCLINCRRIESFKLKYPEPFDPHCEFANGHGWILRGKDWLDSYQQDFVHLMRQNHPKISPHDAMLGRLLDDSKFKEYGLWSRIRSICPKCYREWGQPYYALHCTCKGGWKAENRESTKVTKYIEPQQKIKSLNPSVRKSF